LIGETTETLDAEGNRLMARSPTFAMGNWRWIYRRRSRGCWVVGEVGPAGQGRMAKHQSAAYEAVLEFECWGAVDASLYLDLQ